MISHTELLTGIIEKASSLGFVVDGVFLVGSMAHGYDLSHSDYDVKVISHRVPEGYISLKRLDPVTQQSFKLSVEGDGARDVNISFIDLTHVAYKLLTGKGQHIQDWLQTMERLYISDGLIGLFNLASQTYLATPETSQEMLRRTTQYHWIIGEKAWSTALDPDSILQGHKVRQRTFAALTSACYYLLSSTAESFNQSFPVKTMDALAEVSRQFPRLISDKEFQRVEIMLSQWNPDFPDNGFLILGLSQTISRMLSMRFDRPTNFKIRGDDDAFTTKVRSIVLGS